MPNLPNARKALRQSVKHALHNKLLREEIESLRRHFRVAVSNKKVDEAKRLALILQKKMDKAAKRGRVLKPTTASRLKSRMAKALAKMI